MNLSLLQPDSFIGREIAGYKITDFIDSGAASLVFRGRRADGVLAPEGSARPFPSPLPAVAAIKLLVPSIGTTGEDLADFQRRFAREAAVLGQLTHPHILSALAAGQDPSAGYCYIVLPYMPGGSLAAALARRGPLPLAEVAALLPPLAAALDFAHAHGVIHRDVKPANILLDAHGAPYLGDFGIVRLLSDSISATQRTTIGRVLGSPAYMAPEQFSDTSRVGPLADLYSLGMVVYQLVTGHLAFETTNWPALIYQQLSAAPDSPRQRRPELPEAAAAAILWALEKEPERRFASASAFAQAFTLGLRDEWSDQLAGYTATRNPEETIPAPIAPAVAPVVFGAADSAMAPTSPDEPTVIDQPDEHHTDEPKRGLRWDEARGAVAAIALLLLVLSCLAGIVRLGVIGSAQVPQPRVSSSTPTSAQHPSSITLQTASNTHEDNGPPSHKNHEPQRPSQHHPHHHSDH